MEKKIEKLNKILEDKILELEKAREELNSARKKRKVIELLKDKAYQRYEDMVKREEALELDDIIQKLHLNKEKLTIQNVPLEEM